MPSRLESLDRLRQRPHLLELALELEHPALQLLEENVVPVNELRPRIQVDAAPQKLVVEASEAELVAERPNERTRRWRPRGTPS